LSHYSFSFDVVKIEGSKTWRGFRRMCGFLLSRSADAIARPTLKKYPPTLMRRTSLDLMKSDRNLLAILPPSGIMPVPLSDGLSFEIASRGF
jgi:hypothetical protein